MFAIPRCRRSPEVRESAVAAVYDVYDRRRGATHRRIELARRHRRSSKTKGRGPDVVRDLISYFDRKHPEPTSDTFAMGAYSGVLQILTGMAKEQGLDQQQRRLDRREEKLKELEEKLGKAQSKGADR
jgi:hypothetical protein